MSLKDRISPGSDVPQKINVIVEIPKGSQNKYEYDAELEVIKLDRVLYTKLQYPGEYGFIPQTLALDNDPMDALVIMDFPTYPGVLIECRPIGLLEMVDQGETDDKILCVPVKDVHYKHVQTVEDLPEPMLQEIVQFFATYKQLEGKKVEIGAWKGVHEAHAAIQASIERYAKKA